MKPTIEEHESRLSELEHRARVKDFADAQLRLFSFMYDKDHAYTNLVVVAGYAGFFGLWSITRPYLTQTVALLAALLMGISLAIFVIFEIAKMMLRTIANMRRGREIKKHDGTIEGLIKAMKASESASLQDELRLVRFWPWSVGITLALGLGGIVTLIYAFMSGLLSD